MYVSVTQPPLPSVFIVFGLAGLIILSLISWSRRRAYQEKINAFSHGLIREKLQELIDNDRFEKASELKRFIELLESGQDSRTVADEFLSETEWDIETTVLFPKKKNSIQIEYHHSLIKETER